MNNEKKGIVFKIVEGQKEMHLQPETLKAYIDSLPTGERGWIAFKFLPQQKGRVFAKVEPEKQ